MRAILDIIIYALDLYKLVIVAGAVLSWLIAFGVVNIRNDFVRSVWNLFLALTEPFLRPIRNFLPNTGGIVFLRSSSCGGDAGPAPHYLLRLSVRVLRPNDLVRRQDLRGAVLRDFRLGDHPSRDAPHADQRRRFALFGALRRALRAPKRGDFRARHRLSGKPDRRSARLPCRVRQDGGGRSAHAVTSGYADGRFSQPVFAGDTSATSQVIRLKETRGRSGVVHVRSKGYNQRGEAVIEYVRWVMGRKRDSAAVAPLTHVPKLPEAVGAPSSARLVLESTAGRSTAPERFALSVRGLLSG